jgi:hypothetical protein
MGQITHPFTGIADVETAQKLRVKFKDGTTTSPPTFSIADADTIGIGVNDYLVAAGKDMAIEPYNKSGTLEFVANGVIAEGAEVFPAASGKITATPNGDAIGKAFEAATADGDIIEVLQYPLSVDQVSANTGIDIATTSNSDEYVTVKKAGRLVAAEFSSLAALAANDTNYITWSITNLGQGGLGSAAMLAATDVNTTKATGGSALVANARRSLTVHGTAANLLVAEGDRLRIRAAATGTLAGAVTKPVTALRFV